MQNRIFFYYFNYDCNEGSQFFGGELTKIKHL